MIGVAPLELSVGPGDIGGLETNRIPETDASGWFIYDGIEGGLGFSRSIYDNFGAVARRALALIEDCPCGRVNGCPACLMDDRCGNDNKPLYGPAASDVLAALLGEDNKVSVMNTMQADDVTPLTEPRPPASVS